MSEITKTALLSACGTFRYRLGRQWDGGLPPLPFVMLNPSTADAEKDDPTIRRCMAFARREGAGGIVVVNLFAYRSSKPDLLRKARDPHGPDNSQHLNAVAIKAKTRGLPVICAWGSWPHAEERARMVVTGLKGVGATLVCLGKTGGGHPRHPLYVPGTQALEPYSCP